MHQPPSSSFAWKSQLALTLALLISILLGCGGTESRYSTQKVAPNSVPPRQQRFQDSNTNFQAEQYDAIVENEFINAMDTPKSTFSIDVDTASYSIVRRFLDNNQPPPRGAVRIEEMVNYFDYQYPQPIDDKPFAVDLELASCPWQDGHQLLRVGLKGKEIKRKQRPDANLVFLIDVSGSMSSNNKLPLVKQSLEMMTKKLRKNDTIAIVVYAGASGQVLPPTPVAKRKKILKALDRLASGGSTNGGQGIELAYQIATRNFIEGGTNRVILCTDGDFNVGVTNQSDLVDLISEKAQSGVFLSVFGFGTGNYNDATMEKLSNRGNGNYGYIDGIDEAKKTFVNELASNLITIAKDVKIQLDFNPNHVAAYRLIGYENRLLENRDFADDKKDAGEINDGHTVTAFYELIPTGVDSPHIDASAPSEFIRTTSNDANKNTRLLVNLRYKEPDGSRSSSFQVRQELDQVTEFESTSEDFRFAASVACFGMLLRDSKFAPQADLDWVLQTARESLGEDPQELRGEFTRMVRTAKLTLGPVRKRLSMKSN